MTEVEADTEKKVYTVLARKYRPHSLSELIGQEMLVQTISNAISEKRIPHAFIFTGIRGVGKTSTARILARSLLCEGEDGNTIEPTITPCGKCKQCMAIATDSHVDVLEMDAASRTGVGDIREIIESANYSPVQGRYKIYIIDEVHMLSKSAFNALLKTLEEPPEHIKFIFATTEIRKIPVTILSRCMRFDLPRIDADLLAKHYGDIAQKEGASFDEAALKVIAHAAEGSVRDGLSLLDQVIGAYNGDDVVQRADVEKLIGVSSKEKIFVLLNHVAKGEAKEAVLLVRELYKNGADPVTVLNDFAEAIHFVTQMKVIPDANYYEYYAEIEVDEGKKLSAALSVPYLARLWQMLSRGVEETERASNALVSCEMLMVRLAYVSDLPSPSEMIEDIKKNSSDSVISSPRVNTVVLQGEMAKAVNDDSIKINKYSELVDLFKSKDQPFLSSYLSDLNIVTFDADKCTFEYQEVVALPNSFAANVSKMLKEWTGQHWQVRVSQAKGEMSLNEINAQELSQRKERASQDSNVVQLLNYFEGAKIVDFLERMVEK